MSYPYPQSHLQSSSSFEIHSQVEQRNTGTMLSPDPQSIPLPPPPHFTVATPTPSSISQPSPSRATIPPSSATLVQSSRLPLRKRPAKDQKPTNSTQLQWQPIETAKITNSSINSTEQYPQKQLEMFAPTFGSSSMNAPSSFIEPLRSHSIQFNHHHHHHHQHQQHNMDKHHTSTFLNSPSPLEPSVQPLLSSSIPTKSIHKQQHQQQSAKKKHTNTDENDRPIKKTKRGRPPLSSSTTKPLSSHTSTNKANNVGAPINNTISSNSSSSNSSNSSKATKSTTTSSSSSSSNSKQTSMLYCFCRKPYDESQFMIACDRCEEWFHGECIGIDEKQGEFVDSYFCAACAKVSGKQTSWKPKCSNTICQKAARTGKNQHDHLSKYCSGACGMQVARERLAASDRKQQQISGDNNNDMEKTDLAASFTIRMEHLSNSRLSLFADRDDRLRLKKIRGEKRRAIDTIHILNLKQQFLQSLVNKVEEEQSITDHCGFDSRLLWNDEQWDSVTGVETEPTLRLLTTTADTAASSSVTEEQDWTVCQQKSTRCQRHNGWIKLKTSELEQEREEQFVVLSILARERKLIKARMNNRLDEMNVARSLMNGTLLHQQ